MNREIRSQQIVEHCENLYGLPQHIDFLYERALVLIHVQDMLYIESTMVYYDLYSYQTTRDSFFTC